MTNIKVMTRDGKKIVSAYKTINPNLFVHSSLEIDGKGKWTIAHSPTGYALFHNIRYKKWALEVCEILNEIEGWDKVTPINSEAFSKKHSDVIKRAKEQAYPNK